MTEDEIYLNGKKLISLQRAHQMTSYAKDYIGQLCRLKKIGSERVGRDWFVSLSDLNNHRKTQKERRSENLKKATIIKKHISPSRDVVKEIEREIASLDEFSFKHIFPDKTLAIKFASVGLGIMVLVFLLLGSSQAEASFYKWAKDTSGVVQELVSSALENIESSLNFSSDIIVESSIKSLDLASSVGERFLKSVSFTGNQVSLISDEIMETSIQEFGLQFEGTLALIEDAKSVVNFVQDGVIGFANEYSTLFIDAPVAYVSETRLAGIELNHFLSDLTTKSSTLSQSLADNYLDGVSLSGEVIFNKASQTGDILFKTGKDIAEFSNLILTSTENYPSGLINLATGVIETTINTGENIVEFSNLILSTAEVYPSNLLSLSNEVVRFYEGISNIAGEKVFNLSSGLIESPSVAKSLYKDYVISGTEKLADGLPYIVSDIWKSAGEYVFDNLAPVGEKMAQNSILVGGQVAIASLDSFGGAFEGVGEFFSNLKRGYEELPENVNFALNGLNVSTQGDSSGVSSKSFVTGGTDEITKKDDKTTKSILTTFSLEGEVQSLRQEVNNLKSKGFVVSGSASSGGATIIERTLERVVGGVSGVDLDARLENLNNRLVAQIASVRSSSNAGIASSFQAISFTQKVDQLQDTTINSPTITNPTITGMLTSGAISSSDSGAFGGTISISGTGTSTFTGGVEAKALNITSSTATSTFSNGIQL